MNTEQKRMIGNLSAYYKASAAQSVALKNNVASAQNAASAKKTIRTRGTKYGDVKASDAGIQSITSTANKQKATK